MMLTIAHLYPKLLNCCDNGNIITLQRRCEWRNIDVQIDEINIGDKIEKHDMYFISGGQDLQQIDAFNEIQRYKDFLTKEKGRGAVFLGICGGYQLLGNYYQIFDGEKLEGIGLLDAYTIASNKRFTGNVTIKTEYITPNELVGFENHGGLTYLSGDTMPLGYAVVGNGNNGEDKTEGARHKNVFGTYMQGPFLPKNPHFTDYLIELVIGEKLPPIQDDTEWNAHNDLIYKQY